MPVCGFVPYMFDGGEVGELKVVGMSEEMGATANYNI